jgi:hypothetical protein
LACGQGKDKAMDIIPRETEASLICTTTLSDTEHGVIPALHPIHKTAKGRGTAAVKLLFTARGEKIKFHHSVCCPHKMLTCTPMIGILLREMSRRILIKSNTDTTRRQYARLKVFQTDE